MPVPLLAAAAPLAGLAAFRADGLALPAAIVVALGVAALVLSRRKAARPKLVQILETASLGPKRALIVARVGDETLILGASEAGIALLGSRGPLGSDSSSGPAAVPAATAPVAPTARSDAPIASAPVVQAPIAPAPVAAAPASVAPARIAPAPPAHAPAPPAHAPAVAPARPPPLPAALKPRALAGPSLLGRLVPRPAPVPAFEHALRESLEDQELRAKLAAGRHGTPA